MDHKNCRHLLGSLSEYVDGTLEDALCVELERHLAECEDCQIVIDSLQKTVYLYRSTAADSNVPRGVRTRLFQRLDLDEFLGK